MNTSLSLNSYRLLGRSGLRVSPLALGTMTFGADWGWGAEQAEARRLFDTYVDRGGNFIDTANRYTEGSAERFVGEFATGRRDRLVIATKYTLPMQPDNPNSGGNHRKSMVRSVEDSLRRLNTDYIDLLYLHAWDYTTPVEEIMRAMDDLVHAGKVLYLAVSDLPAWQAARMQMLADLRGWSPVIGLQIEYSLLERTVERELIPMAQELGLGVIPWSPLAGGVLSGKYRRQDLHPGGNETGTRREVVRTKGTLTARNLDIADAVGDIAREAGYTHAQVALAWTLRNPAVTAPIIGARTLTQLDDNLGALAVRLAEDQWQRLDALSAIELGFPHDFLTLSTTRDIMFGGLNIAGRR
ncbi:MULTISPECIES: aldo/keto reductase [unclassified Serratia (in: enterobacteria)]|uniref:aldo/keto reductase n=1 Tax=unclassified Serratia (in: enterobacteria) TaxID=2647522 RepID=UPI002ED007B1|nr:aldo/keto reductase [Serratia sp. C2(2)]MEE4447790.1 aldo/keto reductase [Serratia sp. C2(1)]